MPYCDIFYYSKVLGFMRLQYTAASKEYAIYCQKLDYFISQYTILSLIQNYPKCLTIFRFYHEIQSADTVDERQLKANV
jgi:hypothetical protein